MSDLEQPVTEPQASVLPHDQATVVAIDPVTSTDHKPGSALETEEDRVANEALRAEAEFRVNARPVAPLRDVDAASPTANYLTRNNIVPDGPGTVAEFIAFEAPELLPITADHVLTHDEKAEALSEIQASAAEAAAALQD